MKTTDEIAAFIGELRLETGKWLKEGLIGPRQRELIMARYKDALANVRYEAPNEVHRELTPAESSVVHSRLILTLSILGALLLGTGVILFFSANWSGIPNAGKVAIIFAGILSSYGCGYYLYEKRNYPRVGTALFLLGAIIFGTGIFLIARAYNMSENTSIEILIWGAGVLPVAYALKLRPLLALSLVLLAASLAVEIGDGIHSEEVVALMVILLLEAGVTLWGIGLTHRDFKVLRPLSFPYLAVGMPVTFLAAYLLTFDKVSYINAEALGIFEFRALLAGLGFVFIISQLLRLISGSTEKQWAKETFLLIVMIFFAVLPCIYSYLPFMEAGRYGPVRLIFMVLDNFIYAAATIWLIFLGYTQQRRIYVNAGVLFFALDVLGRYVDVVWGKLQTSLFFLLGGALLIVLGVVLEKKRRKLLASFGLVDLDKDAAYEGAYEE